MLGETGYLARELFCPVPGCDCGEVAINFIRADKKKAAVGDVLVRSSGETVLEPKGRKAQLLQQLWAACQQRHPRYRARLARRDAVMKQLGSRFVDPQHPGVLLNPNAPLRQASDSVPQEPARVVEVGRNDPCPCGSGRKYKKCCGAEA